MDGAETHDAGALDRVVSGLAWGLPEPFKLLGHELRGMRGLFLFDLLVGLGQLLRQPEAVLEVRLCDTPLPRQAAKLRLVSEGAAFSVELQPPGREPILQPLAAWVAALNLGALEWRQLREKRAATELVREALHARMAFFEGIRTLSGQMDRFDGIHPIAEQATRPSKADQQPIGLLVRYEQLTSHAFPFSLPADVRAIDADRLTNAKEFPKGGGTEALERQLVETTGSRTPRAYLSLHEDQLRLVAGDRYGGFIFQESFGADRQDPTFSPEPLHARLTFLERHRNALKMPFWYAGGRLISI